MQLIAQFSEPPDKNLPYAAGCVWILWINKKINKNNAQTLSWPYSAEAENSIEKFAVHFRLRVRKPRGGKRRKRGGAGESAKWDGARHDRKREVSTNREMHLNLIWRSVFRLHSSATVSTIPFRSPLFVLHPCLYVVVHKLTLSLFIPVLIQFLRGHRRRHLARCWRFVNSKSFNNFTFQQLVLLLQKRSNKLAYIHIYVHVVLLTQHPSACFCIV